jgi:DNA modification methylase
MIPYEDFLRAKIPVKRADDPAAMVEPHLSLKPHQRASVKWLVAGGRRALFASFGLGKTRVQLDALRCILDAHGGLGLVVLPLGVRQEFSRDAAALGMTVKFIRRADEIEEGVRLYLTNYESVRDGKLDPRSFRAVSLDEASVLRGFGGTKTFREFMRLFEGVAYKFVATATPSPNDYIELLAYAAFLEIMDVGQAKTRFFKRDSTKADKLTLHPHKEREFWLWVASWALFIQKPSDLGFDDAGYDLPPMRVVTHRVECDITGKGEDRGGQKFLFADAAIGLSGAARAKRDTLDARIARAKQILADDPDSHYLIWHDLEDERRAIERAIPSAVTVWGSQDLEERERRIVDFSDGRHKYLATKPVIAGSGCNFQRHCRKAIFLGIGFKFNDFIQAVHRIYRFLQTGEVEIHIIFAETEGQIWRTLQSKWEQHNRQVAIMSDIVRNFGLSHAAMAAALERAMDYRRIEVADARYRLVNADTVDETKRLPENSVGLVLTSIPFSMMYEYSPSYRDFGHTDDDAHFWAQMDYLIPSLYRALAPGRLAAIHVKDRIVPGGLNGFGFQTLSTFGPDTIRAFQKHGFAFLGEKIITTDVVRENNQTYRLGWTEQCKDGSRMGFGVPEKLLLFRKPQSSAETGYADTPVVKAKKWYVDEDKAKGVFGHWDNPDGYSRARWQIDAHGYTRSDGDRLLTAEEIVNLKSEQVYKLWREFSLKTVYDFEHHVKVCETFEERGQLPSGFMLMPPHSPHPDVWSDITRMLSLNTLQAAKSKEMHLCPMQFDIARRAVAQWSNPGDVVYDPFGGLMTVPMIAVELGRIGWGTELSHPYFLDGVAYVRAAAEKLDAPSMFDALAVTDPRFGAKAKLEAAE